MIGVVTPSALRGDASLLHAAALTQALGQASFAVIECAGPPPHREVSGWNEQATQLFGYAGAEAIGQDISRLIEGATEDQAWQRVLRAGSGGPLVCDHTRRDGKTVTCEWFPAPVSDESGRCVGTLYLVRDITEQARAQRDLEQQRLILRAILDTLGVVVCRYDRVGNFLFQDGKGLAAAGLKPGQLVGMNAIELYGANADAVEALRRGLAGELIHARSEVHQNAWETWYTPLLDEHEGPNGMISITLDASEAKRREDELRAKIELINTQRRVIGELSTPIIEIWDRVLTLPMTGGVDSERTAAAKESLLSAIVSKGARFAILDLTGVETVDTGTANHLVELIRAIRLLGAEGIITGILPSVAQTLVDLNVDLTGIITQGNLRAGLKMCMERMASGGGAGARTVNGTRAFSR